ncbi:MAG: glycosyltransferase family 4 protein [Candidatus Eremiobacteraeota bacterium]|nr:glycosyltransferase family 4 protein [Candidatus Eremiobacteraeota bacterium]
MNAVWATPFFANSAVGELGGRVAIELAREGHHVVLVGTGPAPYITTPLPFIAAGESGRVDPDLFGQFDTAIFNASNHGSSIPIFWLLERVPGIVVLCDRVYVHGLDAYTRAMGMPQRLEQMAQRYYGDAGVDFVRRFRAGTARNEELEQFPFFEPLLELAQCALVHSHEYVDFVSSRWKGLVERLTGFTVPPRPTEAPAPRSALQVGEDDFLLAFVGYITPYRSLDVAMQVLRDRPDLARKTKFAVVGRIEDNAYAQQLQNTAVQYGLGDIMRWGFNANDATKHAVLGNADAAYNCRTLNSEGSSASLLEEMSYGVPTIVNANGFARDIPPDAVCFVERATMHADVTRVLEELIGSPERRKAIGERARAWIATNSTTQSYATTIANAADRTAYLRPRNGIRGRIASVLDEMGVTETGAYGEKLRALTDEMFDLPK